jgi:predicted MPP superfamily phosphohydrolase
VETIELRGRRVQIVGVDPRSYRRGSSRPAELADPDADLRILLCHFPNVIDKLPAGVFDLVLAGHLHAGQIVIPYGRGKVRFSQLRWTYTEGLYRRPGGVMHVSPGLGTTFVPFRFFARPEATELVLRSTA